MNTPKNINGRWFTAVIFLLGLIAGGGGSAFVGHYQYKELEEKIDKIADKVSVLSMSVARIEGHLNIKK
jgi:hypothetical protein